MRQNFLCVLIIAFLAVSAAAQVPISTGVAILKAEDARRYDKTLEALMSSPSAAVRRRAALAAGRIGDVAAVPALVRMLDGDADAATREMAAFALGEIESITAADAIRRAIGETARASVPGANEPPNGNRARLVEAAGKIAAANATNEKTKDLAGAVLFTLEAELSRPSGHHRETVLLGLTAALRARPAGAETTLRKFLAFTDPDIVATALNTMTRLRVRNANRDARDLLATHVHAIVRANAARLLGASEDKEAVDVLIRAATSDTDSRVRVSAIRSLATIREPKSADPLLTRAELLLDAYKKPRKAGVIPDEQSEFIEIATALGRILAKTGNGRAITLFREFAKLDEFRTVEPYIARIRVGGMRPGSGIGDLPKLSTWRQYSTLAQIFGELAGMEADSDEFKKLLDQAPEESRRLAVEFIGADPKREAAGILAAPDALRAFARFKTADLAEVLRTALGNKDVFIRATAAQLISELPASQDNLDALNLALDYAIINDRVHNDATLAAIDALVKLDKRKAVSALALASGSADNLVRTKALGLLKDPIFKDVETIGPLLKYAEQNQHYQVRPYSGKGTRLGQVLNADLDYRRALSRKNGSVSAVVTTQKGTFTIDLLPEEAPLTVDNFVKLARSGYFNGAEVHRVVANFVMQDGDPTGTGSGGPGHTIRCEINTVLFERGTVGMALSGKDTGGSQWFIDHSPQPHLDGGYTVFGRVNETGMKVVDKIVRGDKIVSVRIVERNRP